MSEIRNGKENIKAINIIPKKICESMSKMKKKKKVIQGMKKWKVIVNIMFTFKNTEMNLR